MTDDLIREVEQELDGLKDRPWWHIRVKLLVNELREAWREGEEDIAVQAQQGRDDNALDADDLRRINHNLEQAKESLEAEVERLQNREFEMRLQFDTKLGDLAQRNAELQAVREAAEKLRPFALIRDWPEVVELFRALDAAAKKDSP